jgi:hypothetical protein
MALDVAGGALSEGKVSLALSVKTERQGVGFPSATILHRQGARGITERTSRSCRYGLPP